MPFIGFFGDLAVWYSASLGQMEVIDISTGKYVSVIASVASLAFPAYPPPEYASIQSWYRCVHGVNQRIPEYPPEETLQMVVGSRVDTAGAKDRVLAWEHRLGARKSYPSNILPECAMLVCVLHVGSIRPGVAGHSRLALQPRLVSRIQWSLTAHVRFINPSNSGETAIV